MCDLFLIAINQKSKKEETRMDPKEQEKKETDTKEEETKEEKDTAEENQAADDTSSKEEKKVYDEAYIEKLKAEMEAQKVAAVENAKKEFTAKAEEEAKLSTMTEEEKAAYETAKKEQSIADREAAVALRELQAETKALLAEQGLPQEALNNVIGKDLETTKQNIANLKKIVDTTVNEQVTARLKGKTPERGTGADNADLAETAKEFAAFL